MIDRLLCALFLLAFFPVFASENNSQTKPPHVLMFVSLGMPELALAQTLQQADHYRIPVFVNKVVA